MFEDISLAIAADDKIGLIGPNGIGKTTLLRTLAGQEKPRSGSVSMARGKVLGYVQQEAMEAFAEGTTTVHEHMLDAFSRLRSMETRMREIEAELANPDHDPKLMDEYGELLESFEARGGYGYEERIPPMLRGLGLSAHADHPLAALSGGQKTRAQLARQLLSKPDLLILDEPTNHLDVEAIEWLEGFLAAWNGALLIVSHDRRFLDKVVNKVWEMAVRAGNRIEIEQYRGNYTVFQRERLLRLEHEQFLFDQEKERMQNELRLVRIELVDAKAFDSGKVSWAKGKLKRITRDCIAIEQFGVNAFQKSNWLELSMQIEGSTRAWIYDEALRRVNGLRRPALPSRIDLELEGTSRGSNDVIVAKDLRVGYPDRTLFEVEQLLLRRGARVALIGPNGSGKTTFLKTLFGQIPPLSGVISVGPSVTVAYFAQAHDQLNRDARLMDEFLRHNPGMRPELARHFLAKFLFRGDDLEKYISGLSGGERARLALALLAQQKPNLLVMDEPTNHLDVYALEVLEDVLTQFGGSMLLISHDRQLVAKLANEVWELRGDGLSVYNGSYDEWRAWAATQPPPMIKPLPPPPAPTLAVPAKGAMSAQKSKNERQRDAQALAAAERAVAHAEAELARLSRELDANPPPDEAAALSRAFAAAEAVLAKSMTDWEAQAAAG